MDLLNSATSRVIYEEAIKIITDAGLDPASCKLTQSDLCLEQQLLTTSTSYQFPVLNNQQGPSGTIFNTEIRLNQQDSFIASSWGFFIAKPSSNTDATMIWQTYPNPQIFTTGGVAAAAETLYNSYCKIAVNNDIVSPVWHVGRHRLVPQTQQAPLITGVENAIPYSQVDMSSDAFYPLAPSIVFVGSKNYVINLILPASLAAVETFQRARIWYRGLLAQNSTIIT